MNPREIALADYFATHIVHDEVAARLRTVPWADIIGDGVPLPAQIDALATVISNNLRARGYDVPAGTPPLRDAQN